MDQYSLWACEGRAASERDIFVPVAMVVDGSLKRLQGLVHIALAFMTDYRRTEILA